MFQHLHRSPGEFKAKKSRFNLFIQQERVGEHDCGSRFAMECNAKITYHNLCVILLNGMTVADSEIKQKRKHRRNRWDVAPFARYPVFSLSPPPLCLWETAQYGLKYCLKGPLSPNKSTNHPPPTHTHTHDGEKGKDKKTFTDGQKLLQTSTLLDL